MARKKALSEEQLEKNRATRDRVIEELSKVPLNPSTYIAWDWLKVTGKKGSVAVTSDSQSVPLYWGPQSGGPFDYRPSTRIQSSSNWLGNSVWKVGPDGISGSFQWTEPPTGPTLGEGHSMEGLKAYMDHEEKQEEPPPTYSLKGWLWGVEHTIADIEFDESPIEAVIKAVFGVEPEEEIITVLVRKADGSTEIRAVEK